MTSTLSTSTPVTLTRVDQAVADPANVTLFCIIADGSFDQVCVTEASAKKEKRDLEKLGCEVRIKRVIGWEAADALETKIRGW